MRIQPRVAVLTASCLLLAAPAICQQDPAPTLTFEVEGGSVSAVGWGGGPAGSLSIDSVVVRSGRGAGRIDRDSSSAGAFSSLTFSLPRGFGGDSLELRGWLRTERVVGAAAIWLRLDGPAGPLQFATTQELGLDGTHDWQQFRIALPVDRNSRSVYLGAVLAGTGTVWVDDLELRVDGVSVAEVPSAGHAADAVAADTEFDQGSGISVVPLTPVQTDNLVLLGKVWGFAKYHHPRVVRGEVNWDYELFRILPAVLEATSREAAAVAIDRWLDRTGAAEPCTRCAQLPEDLHLRPDLAWIRDEAAMGDLLVSRLVDLYENRPGARSQHYVSHAPMVGNPIFSQEADYGRLGSVDAGYRLLALYRLWNIIEYWFPYRDLLDEDWDAVLAEFVPELMAAEGAVEYRLDLMRLIARVDDTHANLWRDLALRPPRGNAQLPVIVRFVEGSAIVAAYSHPELGPASGLLPGDEILQLDGSSLDSLVASWAPYYAASNEATRRRDMAASLTRGAAGPVAVLVRREGEQIELNTERVALTELDLTRARVHDLPGETFRRLDDDVAYLKLSSVVAAHAERYIREAEGAKVLVVDIRNYPSEFVVFALGGHLVDAPTPFARFTAADATNPGAFAFTQSVSLQPLTPRFEGDVVVLVDEVSQSQAEYTAMALRAAPNTTVVGSTTAGADGNVSSIPLPGGTQTMISGIGVFYPDRTPTQRIGIIPDIEVRPTIQGIRQERDEVLEAGVSHALGREWRLPR